jgi:hypothetical protein
MIFHHEGHEGGSKDLPVLFLRELRALRGLNVEHTSTPQIPGSKKKPTALGQIQTPSVTT